MWTNPNVSSTDCPKAFAGFPVQKWNEIGMKQKQKKTKIYYEMVDINSRTECTFRILQTYTYVFINFNFSMWAECPEWLTWINRWRFIHVTIMPIWISGNNFRYHIVCSATIGTNNIIISFRQHFTKIISTNRWCAWLVWLLWQWWPLLH